VLPSLPVPVPVAACCCDILLGDDDSGSETALPVAFLPRAGDCDRPERRCCWTLLIAANRRFRRSRADDDVVIWYYSGACQLARTPLCRGCLRTVSLCYENSVVFKKNSLGKVQYSAVALFWYRV